MSCSERLLSASIGTRTDVERDSGQLYIKALSVNFPPSTS